MRLRRPRGQADLLVREHVGGPHAPLLRHRAADRALAQEEGLLAPVRLVPDPGRGDADEPARLAIEPVERGVPGAEHPHHRGRDLPRHLRGLEAARELATGLDQGRGRHLGAPPGGDVGVGDHRAALERGHRQHEPALRLLAVAGVVEREDRQLAPQHARDARGRPRARRASDQRGVAADLEVVLAHALGHRGPRTVLAAEAAPGLVGGHDVAPVVHDHGHGGERVEQQPAGPAGPDRGRHRLRRGEPRRGYEPRVATTGAHRPPRQLSSWSFTTPARQSGQMLWLNCASECSLTYVSICSQ